MREAAFERRLRTPAAKSKAAMTASLIGWFRQARITLLFAVCERCGKLKMTIRKTALLGRSKIPFKSHFKSASSDLSRI